MKPLRVAGMVLELRRPHGNRATFVQVRDAKGGPDEWRMGIPLRSGITPAQARKISRWFADLAEELEKKP